MKKKKLASLIVLVFVLLCNCDYFKSLCEPENAPKKQPTTLQNIVNKATYGEIINLEEWENVTDYTATIDKKLTIKSGNLNGASLTVKAENVKLEKMQNLSVETSSRLTIKDSKLNNLLLSGNAQSRSNTTAEINVILENCEIAEKIKINSQAKLNITGKKTKIAKIVVAVVETLCKIFCAEELDTTEIKDIVVDEDNKKLENVKVSKAYKIVYHSNCEGIADFEDFFSPDDGTISLPTDIFKRDGYIFTGWYYDNNQAVEDSINVSDKTADIHVYARWTKYIPGSGVYSYTSNIENLAFEWGGGFSVLLLTDEQLEVCDNAKNFKQATAEKPEYQIATFGDMIVDTNKEGNFAVYGRDNKSQPYDGVAVTIENNTFTLFIDMTKITKTQLKGLWKDTGNGDEAFMTEDDTVNLTGYKPYVIALGTKDTAPDNSYLFTAWEADLMSMKEGATFPTDLQQSPPTTGNTNSVAVTSISVNSTNHKTSYYVGEEFDLTELTIKVEKSDGTTETISVTSEMITGFDSSATGTQTLTITYCGLIVDFEVEVKENTTGNENEVTEYTVTASEVATTISKLSHGEHILKVTGEITSDTITEIATAMTNNTTPQINLDLSGTTGLTEIPEFAFCRSNTLEGYSNLLSITIPSSVTTIGSNAFEGCLSLTSVKIPSKVDNIGYRAFAKCSNLTKFEIDSDNQNYLSLDDGKILCRKVEDGNIFLIDYPSANGDVIIPENEYITTIEHSAFYACSGLTSVKIPEDVTSIMDCAFEECCNLKSVTIPASTDYIANFRAFAKCSNLTKFEINSDNQNYLSLDDGKILCRKLEDGTIFLIDYPSANGDVSIPENENITTIDHSAFWGCSITSVVIPDSVTYIDCDAFLACANLTSITIPSSVVYIGTQAFSECSNLTNVTFNDTGSTWYCTDSEEYTGGEIVDVTNAKTNANTLKVSYYNKYWYKSSVARTTE